MAMASGYCYLYLFRAYNISHVEEIFDLDLIKRRLGKYPLVKRVLGYIYGVVEHDFYVPSIKLVRRGMYHVFKNESVMLFSEVLDALMFSSARIGGFDCDDDEVRKRKAIGEFYDICEGGDMNMKEAIAEASRKVFTEKLKEPTSNLKHLFQPIVEQKMKGKPFVVKYSLTPIEMGRLQKFFPEINYSFKQSVYHPHAMAAVTRNSCEEVILQNIGYHKSVVSAYKDKDVYVIDIGANYMRHVQRDRYNIHCCNPIIDLKDSMREEDRNSVMLRMYNEGKIGKKVMDEYMNGGRYRCFSKKGECNVKAEYGMFVHSQYDVSINDMLELFDCHEFSIVWSVMLFDVSIFYKDEGFIPDVQCFYKRKGNKIFFSFSGDTSLSYVHDYQEYMKLLTEQIFVTPKGRVYGVERVYTRCGNLFLKFIYARREPLVKTVDMVFNYWADNSDTVVITTWKYDDSLYSDSGLTTKDNPIVSFKRKYIVVDRRFFELLYGHCVRSSNTSFNLNEVFSAALTFNTRMTVNGNDVRAVNRVRSEDLLDVVVAVYCVAYKERFNAGKTMERFVADEKQQRNGQNVGFTDFVTYAWKQLVNTTVTEKMSDIWNRLLIKMGAVNSASYLDVCFFESVRKVELREFVNVCGDYDKSNVMNILNDLSVESVDVGCKGHVLNEVINCVRQRYNVDVSEVVKCDTLVHKSVSNVSDVKLSKTKRNKIITSFHKTFSSFSDDNNKVLHNMRNESCVDCGVNVCIKMPADGHCVFWALGYFVKKSAMEMREILYESSTEQERQNLGFLKVVDGSKSGWGSTDCLRVFSRVFNLGVCVHLSVDGVDVVTRMYSEVKENYVHIKWMVDSKLDVAHVDVLKLVSDDYKVFLMDLNLSIDMFNVLYDYGKDKISKNTDLEFWTIIYDYIYENNLKQYCVTRDLYKVKLFLNRSAYKLNEIIIQYKLSTFVSSEMCLDMCGAPGGFVEVLNYYRAKHICSFSKGEYKVNGLGNNVELKECNIDDYCDDRIYGLVVADGADNNSYKDDVLFWKQFSLAKKFLRLNGVLIIKHNNYFLLKEQESELTGFEKIHYFKPLFSREGNSEIYLICINFIGETINCCNIYDKELEKIKLGVRKYIEHDNTCLSVDQLIESVFSNCLDEEKKKNDVFVLMNYFAGGKFCVNHKYERLNDCDDCESIMTGKYENFINKISSFISILGKSVCSSEYIGKLYERYESVMMDMDNEMTIQNAVQSCVDKAGLSGIDFQNGLSKNKKKKIFPKLTKGFKFLGIEDKIPTVIADQNKCVDLVTIGKKNMNTKFGKYCNEGYGKEGLVELNVDGVAVGTNTRLNSMKSNVVKLANNITYVRTGKYVRHVATSMSELMVDAVVLYERKVGIISSVNVGVQCDLCDDVSEYSSGVGTMETDSSEVLPLRYDKNGLPSLPSLSSLISERVDSLSGSVRSVSTVKSGSVFSSVSALFKRRDKDPFNGLDVIETNDLMFATDSLDSVKVDNDMWINFPCKCKTVVCFIEKFDDKSYKFKIGDGFKYYFKRKENVVKLKDLIKLKFLRVIGEWEGFYFHERVKDFDFKIVLIECFGREYSMVSMFLHWCGEDFSRVAVELPTDLSVLRVVEILRTVKVRVRLIDRRGIQSSIVSEMIGAKTIVAPKPLVFPKLNDKELGFVRSPEYLVGDAFDIAFVNAMIEFKHITQLADNVNAQEYEKYVCSLNDGLSVSVDVLMNLERNKYNLYDNELKVWLGTEPGRMYMYGYVSGRYVWFNEKKKMFNCDERYVLVNKKTEVMLNRDIIANICEINLEKVRRPKLTWVNGPPGCGKTTFIISRVSITSKGEDLILTMTKEGMRDVRKRLIKKNHELTERIVERDVRTVASVLVNGVKCKYVRLFIDEALMMHAGTIGYLSYLTGVEEVLMIGDVNQIPYVDRDHICPIRFSHPSMFCQVTSVLYATYRCPVDVAYSLSDYYESIYSASDVYKSMSVKSYSDNVTVIDRDLSNCLYLVHFQSDKDYLVREGYGKAFGSKVLTIHEAQGLTFETVVLIRLNSKPLLLYDKLEYSIVAVSRHTGVFVYYTDVSDATSKLIEGSLYVDEASLRSWNVVQKGKSVTAGGCMYGSQLYYSDTVMIRDEPKGEYETALVNIPHASHNIERPKVFMEDISFELEKFPVVGLNSEQDINYLQLWYDDKMPMVNDCLFENDQLMVEMNDLHINVEKIVLEPVKGIMKMSRYGKLRPRLRTMISSNRLPSFKESVLGAVKRNLNAPKLMNENMSPKVLAKYLIKNFVNSAIDEDCMNVFESYKENLVELNAGIVDEWLSKQPPSVRKNACSDVPLHLRKFNCYSYMIKGIVKPCMEPNGMYKYASVQTIAYYEKSLNVIFCPIFNILCERLLAVLKKKILIFTNMSNVQFERELNKRLNSFGLNKLLQVENDMSKYDKAQHETLREMEDELLRLLGMPEDLVQVWSASHRRSRVRDGKNGMSFETEFQRKSGDASTFFGNTCVLMCVLLAVYDIDDVELMLLAGDDSVIFFKNKLFVDYDPSPVVADLFNLECKLLDRYSVPYFCSKFLVITEEWIYFVPDPLKFLTKLGRRDMSNYEHVEEYRVSCLDMMVPMFNSVVMEGLSVGVAQRYKGCINDCSKLLCILYTLCSDINRFKDMFIHDVGVQLCMDPSRGKLG